MLLDHALESALNARIVAAAEYVLVTGGRIPARPPRPSAVAFVDLSGFTSLTVHAGDEAAVSASEQLRAVAEDRVAQHQGRLVKMLGDGVLLLLPEPASAVRASLQIVEDCTRLGLPAHAAVAAGRVIRRQGDIFGATVNLAARLVGIAGPGEVVVEEGVIIALPRGTARFEPIGRMPLKGFPDPVAAWRALSPD
jgi:class 3 adenylate cyclase